MRAKWDLRINCDTSLVPKAVLGAARAHLDDMGEMLASHPLGDPFWKSVLESGLRIDVDGWRFSFDVGEGGAVLVSAVPALIG